MLIVGGHHDTQADSPGADDNAAGSIAVMELTRMLSAKRPRRTIRLISFGAEEQLSVGSAVYVRRHRVELEGSARFMLNFDSYGSLMGWTELTVNGPAAMSAYLRRFYESRGVFTKLKPQVMPYSDHFPFVAAGIPAAFLGRANCEAGRFFHHRHDDDMSRVSPALMADILEVSGALLAELANATPFAFASGLPPEQARQAEHYWNDLFGGWEGY